MRIGSKIAGCFPEETFAEGFPNLYSSPEIWRTEKQSAPRKRGRPPGSTNKALKIHRKPGLSKATDGLIGDQKDEAPKSPPTRHHEPQPSPS